MSTIYWFLIKCIDSAIKRLNVGVFEHYTYKSKVKSFLLVRRYRLEKLYMFMKWRFIQEIRYRCYQSLVIFFAPPPNLSYTLWDISGYLERRYYLNEIRRAARNQAKLEKKSKKLQQRS